MKNTSLLKTLALAGIVISISACKPGKKPIEYKEASYAQLTEISAEEDDDSFVLEGEHVKVSSLGCLGFYDRYVIGQFADGVDAITIKMPEGFNGYDDIGYYDEFSVKGTLTNVNGLAVIEADEIDNFNPTRRDSEGNWVDGTGVDGLYRVPGSYSSRGTFDQYTGRKSVVRFDNFNYKMLTVPQEPLTAAGGSFKVVFPTDKSTLEDNDSIINVLVPAGASEGTLKVLNDYFADHEAGDFISLTAVGSYDRTQGGVCLIVIEPWLRVASLTVYEPEIDNVFGTWAETANYINQFVTVAPLGNQLDFTGARSFEVNTSFIGANAGDAENPKSYAEAYTDLTNPDEAEFLVTEVYVDEDSEDDSDDMLDRFEVLENAQVSYQVDPSEAPIAATWKLTQAGQTEDGELALEFQLIVDKEEESSESSEGTPSPAILDGSESEAAPKDVVLAQLVVLSLPSGDQLELQYAAFAWTDRDFDNVADAVEELEYRLSLDGIFAANMPTGWASCLSASLFGEAASKIVAANADWSNMYDASKYGGWLYILTVVAANAEDATALKGALTATFQSEEEDNPWYPAINHFAAGLYGLGNVSYANDDTEEFILVSQPSGASYLQLLVFATIPSAGYNAQAFVSHTNVEAVLNYGFNQAAPSSKWESAIDLETVMTGITASGAFATLQYLYQYASAGIYEVDYEIYTVQADAESKLITNLKGMGFVEATSAVGLGSGLWNAETGEFIVITNNVDAENADDSCLSLEYYIITNSKYFPTPASPSTSESE